MMRSAVVFFCLLTLSLKLGAQESSTLSRELFYQQLLDNHPMVQQANLILLQRKMELREARGSFDPSIYATQDEKQFDDKNYYRKHESGLEIPTWFGTRFMANYQYSSGVFLNPENNLPESGLYAIGLETNLGKGLFMDQRRADLRIAKINFKASSAELQEQLNNVLFTAETDYWNWVAAYNQVQAFERILRLTSERKEALVNSFEAGDKAAIDTLEAFIQEQNRSLALREAQVNYQSATLSLQQHLWNDKGENNQQISFKAPKLLLKQIPVPITEDSVLRFLDKIDELQPKIVQTQYKLESLNIKKRLAAEAFKPELKLKYNLLQENLSSEIPNNPLQNNLKWGLSFSYPLFLRSARGKFKQAKIAMESTALELKQLETSIENKIRASLFKQQQYYQLSTNYQEMLRNYERLLQAEQTKFSIGESSLFLLNSRENTVLNTEIKFYQNYSKYLVARAELLLLMGQLQN